MEDAFFMSRGSLFHSVGAAKVNEHSPYDFNLKIGAFFKTMLEFCFSGIAILTIWCNKFR